MTRTPRRFLTVPSPELRQGVRLALMNATSPAERAHIIQLLLHDMTDAVTFSNTSPGEAVSITDISTAAARHVDRMRGPVTRSPQPTPGAAGAGVLETAVQLSHQPPARTTQMMS